MSSNPQLVQEILDYVRSEYLDADQPLTASTRLLSSGIVDSFSLATLRAHLEDHYGVSIPEARVTAQAFDTAAGIAALVEELRDG